MDHDASKMGWDAFLFGIPLLVLLFFGFFRLDEVFTHRKSKKKNPTPIPTTNIPKHRDSMGSDPDGRPWDEPARRKD